MIWLGGGKALDGLFATLRRRERTALGQIRSRFCLESSLQLIVESLESTCFPIIITINPLNEMAS